MNKDINNHQSDFDINEIWAAIEPQVDEINAKRKKRRPVFIYWLTGVGLLVGIITASFFLLSGNTQDSEKSNTNPPSEIIQTQAPINVISEHQNRMVQNDERTFNKIEKEVAHSTSLPQSKGIEIDKHELITDFIKNKPELILPSQTSSPPNISITEPVNQVVPNPPIVPQSFIVQHQTKLENPKTKLPIETNIVNLTNKNNEIIKTALTKIEELPNATIERVSSDAELTEPNFSINYNSSPFPLKSPRFSIELQGGISAVSRSLMATVDDNNISSFLNLRNDLEEPLEAVHTNLLINAHFKSGFFVSSGVSYTRISELFFLNRTIEEPSVNPVGLQRQIVIAPGDTVSVLGPVVSTIVTNFSTVNYNTYKFFDIPVFVGYEYDFGKWKTDVSFGLFTNILLTAKGRIPNSPTSNFNLETNGRDIFRNRVGFSFQLGLGVSKSLTDKFSMRMNPSVRYYSNNLINDNVGLSQKYLLFGGTLGLRMNL